MPGSGTRMGLTHTDSTGQAHGQALAVAVENHAARGPHFDATLLLLVGQALEFGSAG